MGASGEYNLPASLPTDITPTQLSNYYNYPHPSYAGMPFNSPFAGYAPQNASSGKIENFTFFIDLSDIIRHICIIIHKCFSFSYIFSILKGNSDLYASSLVPWNDPKKNSSDQKPSKLLFCLHYFDLR